MRRPTLSVILEQGNDLVDDLFGRMASTLTLLDLLDVAAALGDKVVDVQHGCAYWLSVQVVNSRLYSVQAR
jgi:hypothetical protein